MHFHSSVLLFCCFIRPIFGGLSRPIERNLAPRSYKKTCVVKASGSNATDDAPAIRQAFKKCGHGGTVAFKNTTYYVNTVLNITGLKDCEIDLKGTLLWGTDIQYWLNHSIPVGYQNQSTAFVLGGDNVHFNGHGYGTLNGNGPVWYHFIHGQSNYPGRPHQITFNGLTNSVVEGLIFLQSQMWTMSMIHSHNNLLENIYVNNTGMDGSTSSNTDGADTMFSSKIHFNKWIVVNGDDSISMKANSTDISITNCTFYNGLGIAIGSIGQYKGNFETIERVSADNIRYEKTLHAAYFKTWTGEQVGYPPNGGGGGLGYASNLTFTNLHGNGFRGAPISISQCTTFSGASGNCTSSKFELENIKYSKLTGTSTTSQVASLQCSGVKPCHDITITDVDLTINSTTTEASSYLCGNVEDPHGWNCTGPVCVGSSATGGC
ncbi:galacturan 1,4-alpha-galacturonidase B [Rhizodiscina lignyota]|uniref:Galacturan 1,4-alpha-galacturonidase B n=1 Tax=Rhizodiscina lignyota TaxID=1504668 RepID=A0A9P4IKM3_9PEZI|nr:galacturan 1,4-alpha-galacturonidase B [Rhizodiscina lignyota]